KATQSVLEHQGNRPLPKKRLSPPESRGFTPPLTSISRKLPHGKGTREESPPRCTVAGALRVAVVHWALGIVYPEMRRPAVGA
ncbi:hypothetical protein ACFPN2_21365, partial [Steroidobacter flavus]